MKVIEGKLYRKVFNKEECKDGKFILKVLSIISSSSPTSETSLKVEVIESSVMGYRAEGSIYYKNKSKFEMKYSPLNNSIEKI